MARKLATICGLIALVAWVPALLEACGQAVRRVGAAYPGPVPISFKIAVIFSVLWLVLRVWFACKNARRMND